jgi:hypothetical protein
MPQKSASKKERYGIGFPRPVTAIITDQLWGVNEQVSTAGSKVGIGAIFVNGSWRACQRGDSKNGLGTGRVGSCGSANGSSTTETNQRRHTAIVNTLSELTKTWSTNRSGKWARKTTTNVWGCLFVVCLSSCCCCVLCKYEWEGGNSISNVLFIYDSALRLFQDITGHCWTLLGFRALSNWIIEFGGV